MEVELNGKNLDDFFIKTAKGDEDMTKIHVLADETLGGIKREYVEIDREAEVGEKIIIVNADVQCEEPYNNGDIFEVESLLGCGRGIQTTCHRDIFDSEYRVLVPVESAEDEPKPADPIDVIASLAQEVASLKRTVDRHRDEIDTLHKDNRTLGEELERLKEPANSESIIESAPFVLVINEGRGEFDVYQRGKKIENISRLEIEAYSRVSSSIDLEFNNVGERP